MSAEFAVVSAEALNELLQYVAQLPLPMGRDALVQAVADSARPVGAVLEPGVAEQQNDDPGGTQ